MLALSLGVRMVFADRQMIVSGRSAAQNVSVDYEYSAMGFTPVIGLDFRPMRQLTVGIRYEYETDLSFKYSEKKLSGTATANATTLLNRMHISDGAKLNQNLPQILALGVEYAILPELTLLSSVNIYFLNYADLGSVYSKDNGSRVADLNEYFDTGYEISLGATYMVLKELKIGAGFLYTESGAKDIYFENGNTALHCSANPPLDSIAASLGVTYTLYQIDITCAALWTHYLPQDYSYHMASSGGVDVSGEYKKDVFDIAIGAGYRLEMAAGKESASVKGVTQ
jgi:long-subunit fatty acid transport protein